MKTKYNPEQIVRYVRMGYTATDLAGILKVSRQRASQIIHACGIKPLEHRPYLMRHEGDLPPSVRGRL